MTPDQTILYAACAYPLVYLQAIFEIITSEYSYQHSLDILVRLIKKSDELKQTINSTDHHHLFSNISDILEASKR